MRYGVYVPFTCNTHTASCFRNPAAHRCPTAAAAPPPPLPRPLPGPRAEERRLRAPEGPPAAMAIRPTTRFSDGTAGGRAELGAEPLGVRLPASPDAGVRGEASES